MRVFLEEGKSRIPQLAIKPTIGFALIPDAPPHRHHRARSTSSITTRTAAAGAGAARGPRPARAPPASSASSPRRRAIAGRSCRRTGRPGAGPPAAPRRAAWLPAGAPVVVSRNRLPHRVDVPRRSNCPTSRPSPGSRWVCWRRLSVANPEASLGDERVIEAAATLRCARRIPPRGTPVPSLCARRQRVLNKTQLNQQQAQPHSLNTRWRRAQSGCYSRTLWWYSPRISTASLLPRRRARRRGSPPGSRPAEPSYQQHPICSRAKASGGQVRPPPARSSVCGV